MIIINKQFTAMILLLLALNSSPVVAELTFEKHANIIRTVKKFIQLHIQKLHKGEFTVSVGRIDPRHRFNRCTVPLETKLSGNHFRGSAVTVAVRCTKPSPWLVYVPGSVSLFKSVYIARLTMSRGHRIDESDIQLMRRNITRLHYGYIDKKRYIIGKVTRRAIFANTILRTKMLGLPVSVKRGQTVILMAESNGIQVRMSGKALASGPIGHSIRVRNLSSRRIVEGTVIRPGVVKINF